LETKKCKTLKAISASCIVGNKGGTEMSTLEDIQRLVDKVQAGLPVWSDIEDDINQLTDLEPQYREDFANRLYEQLDEWGLHGIPEPIIVKTLADQVKVDGPTETVGPGTKNPGDQSLRDLIMRLTNR
jgi:hypothetical protein